MADLSIEELFTAATPAEWLASELSAADRLQLKTTSWQSGGMARTILEIQANMFAQGDGIISVMAQGGFLDFAATGQVTYIAANGQTVTQKVSPDPSVAGENSEGNATWLDVLAKNGYNVTRIGAAFASNFLAIANSTSNTYGPFAIGTYHVSNPTSGAGYNNSDSLTIAPSNFVGTGIIDASDTNPIIVTTTTNHGLSGSETVFISGVTGNTAANGFWKVTVTSVSSFALSSSSGNGAYVSGGTVNVCTVATFAADLSGPEGTSATGGITQPVTVLDGVSCFNVQSFVGTDWESNLALAARCRLKLQALSPEGPRGAYEFFALSAAIVLATEDPPVSLSTPATRVVVQQSVTTGIVNTIVANAGGPVSGISNLQMLDATNTTPIVVQTNGSHTLSTGDFVTITGVVGNTNTNGTFNIVVTDATHFSLDGSSGNAAYVTGGVLEGGDLGQIDKVIQQNVVPDGQTAITSSAVGFNVAIVASVDVPQSRVAAYTVAVQVALAVYFSSLPIGGIGGLVEYDNIIGVIFAAGSVNGQQSYVIRLNSLTINGVSTDVSYPSSNAVADISPTPIVTVIGR